MAFSPVSLLRAPAHAAATGARIGLKVASWSEAQAWGLLRSRMDRSAPLALTAGPAPTSRPSSRPAAEPDLTTRMSGLLEKALENTPDAGRLDLFNLLLDQLTPDEARILGALSDGHASPVVHVHPRAGGGEATITNACLIGKMANVTLPALTPQYVTHLLALGLVELGPELASLKDEYQILTADTGVIRAIRQATRGPMPPRIERQTLRLSPLGHDLWSACFPTEQP